LPRRSGARCDRHQEPAASLALFTSASRQALGTCSDLGGRAGHQVPTHRLHPRRTRRGRLSLPSLGAASFVASPRRCWSSLSQARPPIRYGRSACAPTTSSGSILAWLGDQGVTASSSSTTSFTTASLSLCIGFVSWCSLCRHSPPLCSRRWCRTFSVSLPSDHPWDVAICMRPSGPLHRCRS